MNQLNNYSFMKQLIGELSIKTKNLLDENHIFYTNKILN